MFNIDTIRRGVALLVGLILSVLAGKGIIVPQEIADIFILAVSGLIGFYILGSNYKAAAEKKAEAAKVESEAKVEVAKIEAEKIKTVEDAAAELRKPL